MMRLFVVCVAVFASFAQLVRAQSSDDVVWVQIEAQPNLRDALNRAQSYARSLADVNGFSLGNGWYGIVLGPYTATDGQQVLDVYRRDGLIPRDSYIAFSTAFAQQFFPPDADLLRQQTETARPLAAQEDLTALPQPTDDVSPAISLEGLSQSPDQGTQIPDETPAEARRSERALSAAERRDIQTALQWAGFYTSTIDGAFGRGTRASMSAWQQSKGFEPTGILTTAQRAILQRDYNAVLAGLDLRRVRDTQSGIEIEIPAGRVTFDAYQAPFARFNATDGSKAQVLLISQEGDAGTLKSLYDIMQTLEIVPLEGPRDLSNSGFSLIGRNAEIVSETRVTLSSGQIKGFTLVWPAGDEERRTRLLAEMQTSFARLPGVLDPQAGLEAEQRIDLIAGLQVRKPRVSRSGFYVDQAGTVVTTAEAVQGCTRITLDDEVDTALSTVDTELGVAILTPQTKLAPSQVARFNTVSPRLQSDVAVAGYSYEGTLGAPTVTFGTLSDLRGLGGETDLNRLSLSSLPGDAGGPVFGPEGHVIGMLLPRQSTERQLPGEVRFALVGAAISRVLQQAGIASTQGDGADQLAPEDIAQNARAMTVLVSCWE